MRLLNQTDATMRTLAKPFRNHQRKPTVLYAVELVNGTWCVLHVTRLCLGKTGEEVSIRRSIVSTHACERDAEVEARRLIQPKENL